MSEIDDTNQAEVEQVRAREKAIVTVRTLLVRVRQNDTLLKHAQNRITACEGIIARGPGERKYLQPTLDFWIRQRDHHQRVLDECTRHDADLRALMPAEDIRIAIEES
jgi:hypothetical protein